MAQPETILTTTMKRICMPTLFAALSVTASAATFSIENETLAVSYDDMANSFYITEKASGQAFLTNGNYVNDGYKDDHFGKNRPFHDPLVSNIESYRNGLKLLRKNAGDDVFFSGCCISQNMRELCAIGLVDSMRVGPDYNADGNGMKTGPIRGTLPCQTAKWWRLLQ